MKIKRITSWILCVAMIMTMLPATVFAATLPTPVPYPHIETDVFSAMTNDAQDNSGNDILHGTDLELGGYSYTVDIPSSDTTEAESSDIEGIDATVWKKSDKDITYYRRNQLLNFGAISQANDVLEQKFIDESTPTKISEGAVEIAYMDASKNPLKIKDGTYFDMEETSWDEAWLDLTTDVQRTYVNLNTFISDSELTDLNTGDSLDKNKLTVTDLSATGNQISFMIFNVINGEFSGYLRIKVKDNAGNITIQDYPFIADGQYPEIDITSTTMKNAAGETTATAHANTFISSTAFELSQDFSDGSLKISKRYPVVDESALTAAVSDVAYTDTTGAEKTPSDIWAMDDITISSLKVTDHTITSEIESVSYTLQNYPDGAVISGNKAAYESGTIENFADGNYNIAGTTNKIVIPKDKEGQNILTIVAKDKSGLVKTNRYYFYMDITKPDANYTLINLEDQVVQLFSDADKVTKFQQGVDMYTSKDVTKAAALISTINTEDEDVYQYRLLARDYNVDESDIDLDNVDSTGVPVGYTATSPADTNLTYGTWLDWSLDSSVAVIDEEFDGLIQVRVQDKAGNWSEVTQEDEESVIADNTDAVLAFEAFEVDEFDKFNVFAESVLEPSTNAIENRQTKWIDDSALLWAEVTDEDLANKIRSSGLFDGEIKIKVDFNKENEGKKATLYGFDAAGDRDKSKDHTFTANDNEIILNNTNIADYCFMGNGGDIDKQLGFMVQYDGTGTADVSIAITDKAGNVMDYSEDYEYNVRLRVDKINPIVTFKGYDVDDAATDLLKPNTGSAVDYELRDMPWGPNSQCLEINVVDNDSTPIQSGLIDGIIKIKSDKPIVLKNQTGGVDLTVVAGVEATVSSDYLVQNIEDLDYTFYATYNGTGIAKVEVYAEDEATNERDYPSDATAGDAEVVSYDAMLRVDTIKPEFASVALVETDADVKDTGWILSLFTFDETDVDVNTRKQMKLAFEIVDKTDTPEQSGVNIQSEKITGTELMEVRGKYVENTKEHLYNNKPTSYVTDDINDKEVDPYIDYILLPEEAGEINGVGGTYEEPSSMSNEDIEKLVEKYLDKEYNAAGDKCQWKKASWKDGGIVVPDEFQGAIVLRVADRVGNVEYSAPITFVAESRNPVIDFNPQNGYIYAQNNYGWSKRDYDYVEIRVKDNNEEMVDAWLENVFIKVTDLEGNDISTKDTVSFAHLIHQNDATAEVNPTLDDYVYDSLSGYAYEADYGYDVIDADGIVETIARDSEGYIHLGYVRLAESAQITVTVFDKAKHEGAEYTGNKTTGVWTTRFDRTAPVVTEFDITPLYNGDAEDADNNGFAIKLSAQDDLSGIAPAITDSAYNKYASENIPAAGVFGTDGSYLYTRDNTADERTEIFNAGTFNPRQYELPGLQYALIPGNGYLEDVAPWDFETAPVYTAEGYNGEMGATYVWHNYVNDETPAIPAEFDGLIVVRAVDKAGNITVIGYSSILDVEADDDWNNETQFIQVRTDEKWDDGVITNVQYYGNNNLLFPKDMRKDLSNSLFNGEGAIIEVAEEGITNVVITATEEFVDGKDITATKDARDAAWEGAMNIGNATATGYEDWKYQLVDVKIDKTAPVLSFNLIDENGKAIADAAVTGKVTIKTIDLEDPIPNMPDELGYRSHIASGIAKVEWCAVAEGSSEEKWIAVDDWSDGELGVLDADAFTGTVKVRVTDNAGNETVKSQRIKIDNVNAIVNVSKSYNTLYSREPVDVFVTVTPNAEFSDVKEVTYVVTNPDGSETKGTLPLIGGTISIDAEGESKVVVTAVTKAGVTASDDTVVRIDRTAPEFKLHVEDKNGSVVDKPTQEIVKVTITDLKDAVSGVKTVEWCKVPAGSSEEKWEEAYDWEAGEIGEVEANAFTGTVKVRVVDNAGNETIKSQLIKIDNEAANISISKSYSTKCSDKPVEVYVTVSENGEFSDVKEVTYVVTNPDAPEIKGTLPLIGGTISIDAEKESKVVVTAKTKAGVTATAETTVNIHYYSTLARPSLKDLKSVDWVSTGTVEVNQTGDVVYYSLNGSVWHNVADTNNIIKGLNVGENEIRLQARSSECLCTSDIATYIISYDDGVKKPDIDVIYNDDDVNNWTKDSVVVNISANKDESVSDIASIKYTVSQSGTDKSYDGYLGANGGNVVIQNEGIWILSDIIVTMESGIQYFISDGKETNVDGKDDNVGIETFGSLKNISEMITVDEEEKVLPDENVAEVVVAKIDRTAPVVEDGAFELIGTGNKAEYEYGMDLFSIEDVVESNETLKLKVDPAEITDNLSWITSYKYAVLPVGRTVPTWKEYYESDDGESVSKISKINRYFELSKKSELTEAEEKELDQLAVDYADITAAMPVVVDRAFEGSVLLKVTDNAGNETIVSKTVKTEATAPEISITAPSGWQTEDFMVDVKVADIGVSSEIEEVKYHLFDIRNKSWDSIESEKEVIKIDGEEVEVEKWKQTVRNSMKEIPTIGGSIEITDNGEFMLAVCARDWAGNESFAISEVRLDKVAPEYSGMVQLLGTYNEHVIPESEWNIIHDGWTYNHDVSLKGIVDEHSGIKKVDIKFTSDDGAVAETSLTEHQTDCSFTESGKYDLVMTDKAGNVRNISFTINTKLENVINVVAVDKNGRINIAVTDGDEMLTFTKKENSETSFKPMYNGITDQIWDGKTGVRYIQAKNDAGKKTNTLYVIVAPSAEYGVSLMNISETPNRYLDFAVDGQDVTVIKKSELFNGSVNAEVEADGSTISLCEDGIYQITTR